MPATAQAYHPNIKSDSGMSQIHGNVSNENKTLADFLPGPHDCIQSTVSFKPSVSET